MLFLQEVLAQSTAAVQAGGLTAGLGALQDGIAGAAAAAGGEGWSLTSSGEFWMLLAAQSMAVGTVMVRLVCLAGYAVYTTRAGCVGHAWRMQQIAFCHLRFAMVPSQAVTMLVGPVDAWSVL
jgi:hypothetical protein